MGEIKRRSDGTLMPGGANLNPSGRPKSDQTIAEIARAHTPEAMAKIVDLMRNGETQKIQFDAAVYLVNRGWGTPHQSVDMNVLFVREMYKWPLEKVREFRNVYAASLQSPQVILNGSDPSTD
jgi:hypothetical protein